MLESSSASEPLKELSQRIQAKYPDARFDLMVLPRGPNLAIVIGDNLYEVDYWGTEGFGITHVTEDKSFTLGCDVLITSLQEAEQYLIGHIETQSLAAETGQTAA